MLSVRDSYNETIIKKSKFITYLFRVDSIDDVLSHLDLLKVKYKDATHICYAYILDGIIKCSDDGEPSKTAGMPILNVLLNNNLNHVACFVVRYFGGTKLGANGLVRAYSNCCKDVILDNVINVDNGFVVAISFNYDKTKVIDNLIQNGILIRKSYDDNVYYEFQICCNDYDIIYNDLVKNCIYVKNIGMCLIQHYEC